MAQEMVNAVVIRRGYTYRGQAIPMKRVVQLTRQQFEKAQRLQPPYFREAKAAEVKAAGSVLDLSTIVPEKASNEREAEAALDSGTAAKKK